MQFLGVIVSAIAGFGVGAVWYMALAKQWMAAIGTTEEEIKADGPQPLPFILAFVAAVLSAGAMRHIFAAAGIDDPLRCLGYGAGFGAFLAAPWIVMHYAFQETNRALWWIDAGHTIAAFAVMGLVLGFFV